MVAGAQTMQPRCVAMTEHGFGSDGKDGCEAVRCGTQLAMADGVDTAVQLDEQPSLASRSHHRRRHPKRVQLPSSYNTVLAICQLP